MKRFVLFFSAVFALASCIDAPELLETVTDSCQDGSYPITVEVEEPELIGPGSAGTRSSYSVEQLTKISDMNIFIYHQGKLLSDYCKYITDLSSVSLTLPADKDGFDIYLFGNVGRMTAPENEYEVTGLRYVAPSYSDFLTKGFPVANVYENYTKNSQQNLKVKRLIGQYNITLDPSATEAKYTVTGLRIYNPALDVYPFSYDTKATAFGYSLNERVGDSLTESDLAKLNSGGTVSLYFIENLQGVLLPGNTDRSKKIPSQISTRANFCTYIELTVDVETAGAKYRDGKYRFYLGADETTDFSIRRNTIYNATIDFTQNMVFEEEWRIDHGTPDVGEYVLDRDYAMVIKGAEDMLFLNMLDSNGNPVDFDVLVPSSGNVNVMRQMIMNHPYFGDAIGLRFTSDVPIDGLYPFDKEPTYISETVTLQSKELFNGEPVYKKEIEVRIYHKLFPLHISLEDMPGVGSDCDVVLRGRNPMNLPVGLAFSGELKQTGRTFGSGVYSDMKCRFYTQSGLSGEAVGENGVYMGNLDSEAAQDFGPSDVKRIDFLAGGISRSQTSDGYPLAYPRLLKSDFNFNSDSEYAAKYYPHDMRSAYSVSIDYVEGFDQCTTNSSIITVRNADTDVVLYSHGSSNTSDIQETKSFSKTHSEVGSFIESSVALHALLIFNFNTDTGINKGTAYDHALLNDDDYVPFYFVNSGMTSGTSKFNVSWDFGWLNRKEHINFRYEFYAPGRDLFRKHSGSSVHTAQVKVSAAKTIGGKVKYKVEELYHTGNTYMTINGRSSWPGADETPGGFVL